MNIPNLFTPVRLGAVEAPNRIVMAPLTRMRAGPGRLPTPLMAEYYAQRAAAGLIVSEATAISQQGTAAPTRPASSPTNKSPAGGKSPKPCIIPVAASFFSFGTWAGFLIHASNRTAGCPSRLAPSLLEPVKFSQILGCSRT